MKIKDIVEARMSAAVKLQRAFEREQNKSTASRDRAAQAKAEFEKDWKAKQEKEKQGVEEGNSGAKYKMVCKDCGDVFNKPTTDCRHDSHNPNGPNWTKKNEDAAGVGIITKQNTTVDVNKNTPKKNFRAFRL